MQNINLDDYFLPYQQRWLEDNSKYKIWEKSRRIGATYVQSYEDVKDCVTKTVEEVWFSSADESAAREYIEYCEKWVELFDTAAKSIGRVVIDSENDVKAYVIEFANGTKISALSSNPKRFRSKGGKVILDEFAHHNNAEELWSAANPCTMWGDSTRILSTHNGQNCQFFKFIQDIKAKKLDWSLHTTSIQLAVAEGLVDKISGKEATEEERQEWLQRQEKNCVNKYTWLQEYCCIAVDETSAFLPYDLIVSCEADDIKQSLENIKGYLYVGMDIGRDHDLSVIWVLEKLGKVNYTRSVIPLPNMLYQHQEEALYEILKHPKFRRCCIDATGQGNQFAERATQKFGKYRVEGLKFTNPLKEVLAYGLRTHFENKTVYIPSKPEIREDLHSIQRTTTAAGNIRFDAERSALTGHADRFWALALALHAAPDDDDEPFEIETGCPYEADDIVRGMCDEDIDWDDMV